MTDELTCVVLGDRAGFGKALDERLTLKFGRCHILYFLKKPPLSLNISLTLSIFLLYLSHTLNISLSLCLYIYFLSHTLYLRRTNQSLFLSQPFSSSQYLLCRWLNNLVSSLSLFLSLSPYLLCFATYLPYTLPPLVPLLWLKEWLDGQSLHLLSHSLLFPLTYHPLSITKERHPLQCDQMTVVLFQ